VQPEKSGAAGRKMLDQEFEAFKRNVDLHSVAESMGYSVDPKESWGLRTARPHYVMRKGNIKITVNISPKDGHWTFNNWADDSHGGSVIDFLQHETSDNFGQIRKRLRAWSGSTAPPPVWIRPPGLWKDREAVAREYAGMHSTENHAYLTQERSISPALLASPRFAGRVRVDLRGNAIFPHFDGDGLCGFEKKNRDFTGFASGGVKGLWESHDQPEDRCLVVAESAIDALSYAALFPALHTRYRSTGGQVNEAQPALLRAAVLDLRDGSEVTAAMDNDDAGRKLAAMVQRVVAEAGRPSLTFHVHFPPAPDADWNDVLREISGHSLPAVRSPSVAPR
jgi:hypothetical protein